MSSKRSAVLTSFRENGIQIQPFPLIPLDDGIVEISVQYCGINFQDVYSSKGLISRQVPRVMGAECAGVITAVGPTVKDLSIGDRVIAYDYEGGMFSDLVRTSSKNCFHVLEDLPLDKACAMFVNYLTAYYSVIYLGKLQKTESVLIKSCSGGVGVAATQLAKTIPAVKIFGTTSPYKENFARENGIHHVIDLEKDETKFDLILSNECGPEITKLLAKLKTFGRLILLGANNYIVYDEERSNKLIASMTTEDRHSLLPLVMGSASISGLHLGMIARSERASLASTWQTVMELHRKGHIDPKINEILSLEEVQEGLDKLKKRKNMGKILLMI